MKRYNVTARNAYNEMVQIFLNIDETMLSEFLSENCDSEELENGKRWMKWLDLPEYKIPYSAMGWLISYSEA